MLPIALMTVPATRSSAAASAWPMTGIHETTRARMPAMPAIVPATSVITESTSFAPVVPPRVAELVTACGVLDLVARALRRDVAPACGVEDVLVGRVRGTALA